MQWAGVSSKARSHEQPGTRFVAAAKSVLDAALDVLGMRSAVGTRSVVPPPDSLREWEQSLQPRRREFN
jgi:hypothetical protein